MAYTPGSILSRLEPLPDIEEPNPAYDPDDEASEPTISRPHPLNKIRIVGPSPIAKTSVESWEGSGQGDHVIVAPEVEFGANEVAPVGALQAEYEITDYAEEADTATKIELESPAHRRVSRETPEEVFARQARADKKAEKEDAERKNGPLRGAALAAKQRKEAEAATA